MDSPTDQEDAPSPSTSDIENFRRDLLERARARSKLIDGQVPPPLKERPTTTKTEVEMELEEVEEVPKVEKKKAEQELEAEAEINSNSAENVEEEDDDFPTSSKKTNEQMESEFAPTPPPMNMTPPRSTVAARSSRLSRLASTINGWEEDMTKVSSIGNRSVVSAIDKRSPVRSTPPARRSMSPVKSPVKPVEKMEPMLGGPKSPPKQFQVEKSPPKQVQFSTSTPKALQFVQSPPKVVQVPESPPKQPHVAKSSPKKQVEPQIMKSPSKAALEPNPEVKDPCSVIRPGTVSQHRMLFEGSGRPIERDPLNIAKGTVLERRLAIEKGNAGRPGSPVNRPPSPVRNELIQEGTRTVKKLFGNAAGGQGQETKQKEPAEIPAPPPPPPSNTKRPHSPTPTTPNTNYPGLSGLKKLRPTPSPPKPGNLYPSLTDIECDTEQEGDLDESGESLGCVIEKVAKSSTGTPMQMQDNTCTVNMAIGSALDALDDALEGEDYTLDTVMESQLHAQASSTPNTAVPSSISEEFSGTSYLETDIDEVLGLGAQDVEDNGPKVEPSSGSSGGDPTITSSPITRVSAAAPATTVNTTPLMHTVSFYRRTQQQQTPSAASTSKIGARKHLLIQEEEEPDDEAEQERVNEEIHELETQASAQTRAIAQASKALNVCNSSMEFSDSTERVECERVLLLSTNRRSALLNHVQSLRTEAVLGRTAYFSTATLSIGRIRIQAPRCGSHNSQMMRMHHYVLLARCGQYVEASEVLQRDQEDSSEVLEFKGLRLQGLNKDFRVILELYGMETGREYLSHDAKYKILKKIKNPLTPSKKQHLPMQSPAGPNAILSTSFALQASLTIVIGDLNKKQFQMTTSNSSGWGLTLDTELQANATCSVKHSGYLALFEDVNGLGCWVRRWAHLGNGWMQFWMYEGDAEDENKPPITTIPLASITTSTVRPPPPSVCARANSILMESVRERRSSDKPSLTTELSGSITRVKWLLAADSKEERAEWLEMLNTVLEEHRRWQK